jgi:hypothetical protein
MISVRSGTYYGFKILVMISLLQVLLLGDVEYEDKFQWDAMSRIITPELFAQRTVEDLKLPKEMAPVIAHRIREYLFRYLIHTLTDTENDFVEEDVEVSADTPKVSGMNPSVSANMSMTLWERAKPNSMEDNASFPQPLLPKDRHSNATVWD